MRDHPHPPYFHPAARTDYNPLLNSHPQSCHKAAVSDWLPGTERGNSVSRLDILNKMIVETPSIATLPAPMWNGK